MFSKKEREEILDDIINFLKSQKVEIISVVGSNGTGKADEFSDIDMSVVVSKENLKVCFDNCVKFVKNLDYFRYFETFYNENSMLVGAFLNNGLELDIGFVTIEEFTKNRLKMAKSKIKIVYGDKSLENIESPNKKDNNKIDDLISTAWYNIKNSMVALKRGNLFRGVKEIEELRIDIVDAYSSRNAIESKHFREVDKLDEEFKTKLAESYLTGVSYNSIKNSLINTLNLLCFVLNKYGYTKDSDDYKNLFNRLFTDINL